MSSSVVHSSPEAADRDPAKAVVVRQPSPTEAVNDLQLKQPEMEKAESEKDEQDTNNHALLLRTQILANLHVTATDALDSVASEQADQAPGASPRGHTREP
jgi:hypothetical protein